MYVWTVYESVLMVEHFVVTVTRNQTCQKEMCYMV